MILIKINHPCLRVRRHIWYQSHYKCNTSRTNLFLKTYGEDTLRSPYKNYSSDNRWQLTKIYFLQLLCVTYISETTHQRKGKKVSIFLLGDVCHVYCTLVQVR
jgi:hypothetical protein